MVSSSPGGKLEGAAEELEEAEKEEEGPAFGRMLVSDFSAFLAIFEGLIPVPFMASKKTIPSSDSESELLLEDSSLDDSLEEATSAVAVSIVADFIVADSTVADSTVADFTVAVVGATSDVATDLGV